MERLRPLLYVLGFLLSLLACTMIIPGLVDAMHDNPDWETFAASAFITGFVGVALMLTNRGTHKNLSIRQAFLLTTGAWVVIAAFAALPLALADLDLSYTDAYFEAMSGLTTTGASVMVGLDKTAPGILLWRAILTGLGGIGIIVMAMTVLPMLKIGGMQLFRTESSDRTDKIMPRANQISRAIILSYFILAATTVFFLCLAGMGFLDAICHSLSAISTAGFSTYDASIAHFNSPLIEFILIIAMIGGALPFVHYISFIKGNTRPLYRDSQVRYFLGLVAIAIAFITWWGYSVHHLPFWQSLRHSSFNVVSIVTTTGFASTDYTLWGSFVVVMIFVLSVIGGCTGSTTGGIKIFRLMALAEIARVQINQLFQPHAVMRPLFNGKPLSDSDIASVMGFIILWAITFTAFSILVSATGLDFTTSLSAVAAAMANTGPGLGHIVGPAGNYATIPDTAKWLLSAAMMVGRLELFSVLVLFAPRFWRG